MSLIRYRKDGDRYVAEMASFGSRVEEDASFGELTRYEAGWTEIATLHRKHWCLPISQWGWEIKGLPLTNRDQYPDTLSDAKDRVEQYVIESVLLRSQPAKRSK